MVTVPPDTDSREVTTNVNTVTTRPSAKSNERLKMVHTSREGAVG
jgi:hypothetical protein